MTIETAPRTCQQCGDRIVDRAANAIYCGEGCHRDSRRAYTTAGGLAVVYFIQQATTFGPVKIGYASNISNRYTSLAVSCPTPLCVRAIIPAKSRELEMIMHERFAEHRMYREWFDVRFAEDLEDFMASAQRLLADYIEPALPRITAEIREQQCIPTHRLRHVQRAARGFDEHLIAFYPKPARRRRRAEKPLPRNQAR